MCHSPLPKDTARSPSSEVSGQPHHPSPNGAAKAPAGHRALSLQHFGSDSNWVLSALKPMGKYSDIHREKTIEVRNFMCLWVPKGAAVVPGKARPMQAQAWAEWPGGCIVLLAFMNEDRHLGYWDGDLVIAERKPASFPGKSMLKGVTQARENFSSSFEEKIYSCSVHRCWAQGN